MSYDLKFWKDLKRRDIKAPKPSDTYTRLNDGETLSHVAELPIQEILDRLIELFPDFEPEGTMREIELPDGNIEVSWGRQHFRIDLRGDTDEAAGQIVTLMNEFGCRVYDPQADQRYPLNKPTPWNAPGPDEASESDRDVKEAVDGSGTIPSFEELLAQRKAEREEKLAALEKTDPEAYRWAREMDERAEASRRARQAQRNAWEAMLRPIAANIERDHPDGRWRRFDVESRTLAAVLHNMSHSVGRDASNMDDFGQLETLQHQLDNRFLLVCLGFLKAIPVGGLARQCAPDRRHGAAVLLRAAEGRLQGVAGRRAAYPGADAGQAGLDSRLPCVPALRAAGR